MVELYASTGTSRNMKLYAPNDIENRAHGGRLEDVNTLRRYSAWAIKR